MFGDMKGKSTRSLADQPVVVALDQGTTSSRALLFDGDWRVLASAQREFRQHFPRPGWVEHDPMEIWHSQLDVLERVLRRGRVSRRRLAGIGIANQRETTLLWERKTGTPIGRAIVWQDRRTTPLCRQLEAEGLSPMIRKRTGLRPDPYFSATKIQWLLDKYDPRRVRARRGELCCGTIDSWLIWQLNGGEVHATDVSNASRTLLFDIRQQQWDPELLDRFSIPPAILPEVRDSSGSFGHWRWHGTAIPILGVAGDQQAALFGQGCLKPGMAKNTYGTGCFLLLNTGRQPSDRPANLLATIAWRIAGRTTYALEGSVLVAGAAIQWLRDELQLIDQADESEALARSAVGKDEVYVVPAFAGLGAPHWDMQARGAIFGLTRGTGRAEIVKATLESLAFQTRDMLDTMRAEAAMPLRRLRVDGGAAANDYLMQFQADLLGIRVERPALLETTALGAARLAGTAAGLCEANEPPASAEEAADRFAPRRRPAWRVARMKGWHEAVARTRGWLDAVP